MADNIKETVAAFSAFSPEEVKKSRMSAERLSRKALWSNFIKYYEKAYDIALKKAERRKDVNEAESK